MRNIIYTRALDLSNLLKLKSFFLFGPRATGKTTLIRQQLSDARVYDLLDAEIFASLVRRPKLLQEQNPDPKQLLVIDEIQKLPQLLDEAHRLIELEGRRFLFTGSSARKLRRGAANLLAGRAFWASLFPLSFLEISDFDLLRYLNRGGLPAIYTSRVPHEELRSYANLYLREEIQAEGLVRNLPNYARFLDTLALSNGEEVNYESWASDCGVPARTLHNYLQIAEDTLIAYALAPFRYTLKRKAITRKKVYLFDVGITNTLAKRGAILDGSELFGRAFEHFIINEVRAFLSYARVDLEMQYWRSTSQFEVDLVLGKQMAIEIKSTNLATDKHLKGLRALKEEQLVRDYVLVSRDSEMRRTHDNIVVYPWQEFLTLLWQGKFIQPVAPLGLYPTS